MLASLTFLNLLMKMLICKHVYRQKETIHGDQIIHLNYKRTVWSCCLCVPPAVIETPPKGGLADGTTDEEALGFGYTDLWMYYNDYDNLDKELAKQILQRIVASDFKRQRFNPSFIFSTTVLPKG